MDTSAKGRLNFRRQYIIAPENLECPFDHRVFSLNEKYKLFAHIDLLVTTCEQADLKLILLGDMFDFESPEKSNFNILTDLLTSDFNQLLERTTKYSGRYVLIYMTNQHFFIFTDVNANRKVYYSNWRNKVWIASQAHLLARVLGFNSTNNRSKLAYYESEDFKRLNHSNIGNTTYYDEIYQLIPNHYLDVAHFNVKRYWPNEILKTRPFMEVANECAVIIKGYIEAIAYRYDIMLPVTAGFDSRMLLAGAKDIKKKVFFYINRDTGYLDNHPDIKIPLRLFKKLKLDFHILELENEIDEDFETVFFNNNPIASPAYLPHIYNYYKYFPDKVNLPANYTIARVINRIAEKNVTPYLLATYRKENAYEYEIQYYSKWLESCRPLCKEYNIEIMNLHHWEDRIANWGTNVQLDKDIASEDLNPLNSRLIESNFLSVEKRYSTEPRKLLNRKIIELLWPELLSEPINPGFYNDILKLLAKINLLGFLYKFKYKTSR